MVRCPTVPYEEGLEWLPEFVVLSREDLVEILPALRALVGGFDRDVPEFACILTVATVLARAIDRPPYSGEGDDHGEDE